MTVLAQRNPKSTMSLVPFDDVIVDSTGGNPKVQLRDYLAHGKLPVVDQGQSEIGGYTDDEDLACRASRPCVLFGDHTKTIKWIDYPFALGADGVKVLTTTEALWTRYAYHFLR